MRRMVPFLTFVMLLAFTGCYELLSWSPGGRYLAVAMPDAGLWLWDTQKQQARQLTDGQVSACRYMPSGKSILVGIGNDELDVQQLLVKSGTLEDLGVETEYGAYDLARDGRRLYYVQENENTSAHEVWEMDLRRPDRRKLLFESHTMEILFPKVSPTRKQILFCAETDGKKVLYLLKPPKKRLRRLRSDAAAPQNLVELNDVTWPAWIDDDRFAYILPPKDNGEGPGSLCVYSLAARTAREVCQNVMSASLAISPDCKSAVVTLIRGNGQEKEPDPGCLQLASIDIKTGVATILSNEPLGAAWATFSPNGRQIAYLSPLDVDADDLTACILDLRTRRKTVVWRNDEERGLSQAEGLYSCGKEVEALRAYQDLLARFPETRFADLAWYRIMQLYLAPPLLNPEQARAACQHLESSDLEEQAASLLKREAAAGP